MEGQYCRFYYTNPDKPDLQELLMREGLDGYGAYWLIIALLGRTDEHIYPTDYQRLAWAIHTEDVELVERVVCNFGLFVLTDDREQFYCDWLKAHCDAVDIVKTKRSEAGKKGMQTRWGTTVTVVPVKSEAKTTRKTQSEARGMTCNITLQPSEAELKALDDAGMVPTTAVKVSNIPSYENYSGDVDTYSPEVVALCNEIAAKFNTFALPIHLSLLQKLIQALYRPGGDAMQTIRDGLKKYDTAEAIQSKRIQFDITTFLKPETFLRLYEGRYDTVYQNLNNHQSNWQDAGKTFENMTY